MILAYLKSPWVASTVWYWPAAAPNLCIPGAAWRPNPAGFFQALVLKCFLFLGLGNMLILHLLQIFEKISKLGPAFVKRSTSFFSPRLWRSLGQQGGWWHLLVSFGGFVGRHQGSGKALRLCGRFLCRVWWHVDLTGAADCCWTLSHLGALRALGVERMVSLMLKKWEPEESQFAMCVVIAHSLLLFGSQQTSWTFHTFPNLR